MVDTATVSQLAHLGAGIAIGFGAVGAGLGIGFATKGLMMQFQDNLKLLVKHSGSFYLVQLYQKLVLCMHSLSHLCY